MHVGSAYDWLILQAVIQGRRVIGSHRLEPFTQRLLNAKVSGAQLGAPDRATMAKSCASRRGVLSVRVRSKATSGLTALLGHPFWFMEKFIELIYTEIADSHFAANHALHI